MSKQPRRPGSRRRPGRRPAWVTSSSGAFPTALASFELGVRLAALTREERLQTALDFVAVDLAELTDEQRVERLRVLFTILRPRRIDTDSGVIMWEASTHPDTASLGALQALQTQLRDGLRDFLNPATAWAIPAPARAVLVRNNPHQGAATTWYWQAEAWPMIVAGLADLVWEYADRVRACQWCGRVFLAVKRQQFCTPDHAQKARDHKKATRRKGGK